MSKSKSRKTEPPTRVLALPDLEHTKTAVLNRPDVRQRRQGGWFNPPWATTQE